MPSGVRLPHPLATHGETGQIKTRKFKWGWELMVSDFH